MSKFIRDDTTQFHETGLYIPTRTIEFFEEVDDYSASNLMKNLHILDAKSQEPIVIKMTSPGGCAYNMWGIYDFIKECRSHITIIAYGYCMSAATIILQAADDRILTPNIRFMVHYGIAGIDWMHSKDFQAAAEDEKVSDGMMEDVYLEKIKDKHPKYTRAKLKDFIKYDKYMSARETIALGLADKILGE